MKDNTIFLERIPSELDQFVLRFVDFLSPFTEYVIVSGYVSILLGRSRASEDVDFLFPRMKRARFEELFHTLLSHGYERANTSQIDEAFSMLDEHAIRFYEEGVPVPNIEFKCIKRDIERYAFEYRTKVLLSEKTLFISPLELQLAFKLFLSSEPFDKDIEDARHLYKVFKENINKEKLLLFAQKLEVQHKLRQLE